MKSTTFAMIAMFASAAVGLVGTASADTTFDITSIVVDPLNPQDIEVYSFEDHVLGTFDTTGGVFPIMIASGNSTLAGFDYQLLVDYTQYDIGYFGQMGIAQIILDNLENYDAVVAQDQYGNAIGSLLLESNKVTWESLVPFILAGGDVVTFHWTISSVPAPGAIALLGLAGCVGVNRRRQH